MKKDRYLGRINYGHEVIVNEETLIALHEHHVLNVPFENIDIHYNHIFDLELDNLYRKIVVQHRGGFCYELNALFNALLCDVGFDSKIISARIFDDIGNLGPEFDHMCICVNMGKKYLVDVGFGDLFIKPLEIRDGIQSDDRNLFNIQELGNQEYVLSMCSDRTNFHSKYVFSLNAVQTSKFYEICSDKQTSPLSYFVKNTICTKPIDSGRITLFNEKFIEKIGEKRIKKLVRSDEEFRAILKDKFGVEV